MQSISGFETLSDRKQDRFSNCRDPSPKELEGILIKCGIRLSNHQIRQLWVYHQLLRKHNPELNLTRIHSFANMVVKLYADSLLPGRLMEIPSPLLDLGTGAGMPGIPLKIAHPKLEIHLAEGRGRRADFLREAIEELGLSGIHVIGKGINERFEQPVQAVITRAVGTMVETMRRVHGCLAPGGLAIFMKGPNCEEEIQEVGKSFSDEYELERNLPYRIGDTTHRRRLVVFMRKSFPPWAGRAIAMKRHVVRAIESGQNETFKDLKRVLTAKGIKKLQMALVSGHKQVNEILRDFPSAAIAWISCADADPPTPDVPSHVMWYQLARFLFETVDLFGTNHPLLLIMTAGIERWDPRRGLPSGTSVFVPFQDPENVGAVIRSAVAFGVDRIILLEESANPYHPKALRASGGAVLHASLMEGPSIRDLPRDLPIFALSVEGRDIASVDFPETFGLLPGLEGPGLPWDWKGVSLSVPICRKVESLNAATATAIALYVWSQRMKGQGAVRL